MILRCLALLLLLLPVPALAARSVIVAAAADLRSVLPALAAAQEARSGQRLTLVFGSSGKLAQQAVGGAPFDLLLLADAATAERVTRALPGATARPYALARLALVARPGRGLSDLAGLPAALAAGRIRHLAIANPAHAPYGAAAAAVLARIGASTRGRLVLGDNVAQALAFVTSGAAEAGIVALPLVQGAGRQGLDVAPIAPTLHPALVQTLVIMPGADANARALAELLTGAEGRAALAAAGFGPP